MKPVGGSSPFRANPRIFVPEMNSKSSFRLGSKNAMREDFLSYAATRKGMICDVVLLFFEIFH